MNTLLQQILIGLTVSKIEEVHDYFQIVFSDGTILSVYNNYIYDDGSVLSFADKKIKLVEETDEAVAIVFEDGSILSIGLNDDDYYGPEAMTLCQEGKPMIVCN